VSKSEGVPFLSARNIKLDGFELDSAKYVSFQDHQEFCKRTKPERGDILYTKGGTTGVARVNDLDFEFSVWVHVAVLKIAQNLVYPYYLATALNSPLCYVQSQKFTHGSSNSDLGLTRMVKIVLPLSPLKEQYSIVAKVEQLMALCDKLEAKLKQSPIDSEQLMDVMVQNVLAA
jgi:type I restriction enzyme S subunit